MNPPVFVTVPPVVVSTTSCAPAVPIGVNAVILVAEKTTTLVAATPPTFNVAPTIKLVPVKVISVPPRVVPEFGEILSMVGRITLE